MRVVKEDEKRVEQKMQEKGPGIEKRGNSLDSFRVVLSSGTEPFCIILADAPLSPVGHLTRQAHFPPYVVHPGGCFKAEIMQEIYHVAQQIPRAGRKSNWHDLNFNVSSVYVL